MTRAGRLGDIPASVWLMLGIALLAAWTFLQTGRGEAALLGALAAFVAGRRALQAREVDRGRLAITRVGQAVVAVGAVGFAMGRPDILVTALVLLAIGAVTALRGVGNAAVAATTAATATVGDRIPVDVRVRGARGATEVVLLDPQSDPVVVDGANAGSMVHPCEHRGVFHHLRVILRSRGWLGLCVVVRLVVTELDRPIQVRPRPRRTSELPPLLDAAEGDDGRLGGARGRTGMVRGVRPYAPGDARRHVHWPSTARVGELVVTEVDAPSRPAVDVVVELPPLPELSLPSDVVAWQRTGDRLTGEALYGIGDLLARGVPVRLVTIEAADLSPGAPDVVVTDMVPDLRTAAIRLARARPGPARQAAPDADGVSWVIATDDGQLDPEPDEAPGPRHAEHVARLRSATNGQAWGLALAGILAVALDGEVPQVLALLLPLAAALGGFHLLARTWPRPVEQAIIGLGSVPLLVALDRPATQAMMVVPMAASWVAVRTLVDRRTAVLAGWCAAAGPPPARRTLGVVAAVSAWMAAAVAPRPTLVVGLLLATVVSALAVAHGSETERAVRLDGRTPALDRTRLLARWAVVAAVLLALLPVAQLARDRWGPGDGGDPGGGGPFPASTTGVEPWVYGTDRVDGRTRPANGDAEILWVSTDRPLLLRGQTFDTFDGRAWTQSAWGPSPGPPSPSQQVPPTGARVVQTVTVRARGAAVLPAAPEVAEIRAPGGLDVMRAPDGAVFASSPLLRGDTYEVVSVLPDATRTSLRAATGPVPDDVLARYAQPPPISERAAALVDEVAGDLPTAHDQVQALQAMLAERVTYSLDAPLPPVDADVVDHFLFRARSGWCEQIAATLAASMRHLGVPARLVTGFAPGEWDPAAGHFVVRARDAHAWVEVFFPGVGWQGFDPTARVPLSGTPAPELPGPSTRPVWLGLLAAVALLGVVAATGLLRRRRDRAVAAPQPWVDDVDARLRRLGTAAGMPRTATEGVVRHGRRLAHALGDDRIAHAGRVIERAAYGPTPVDAAERHEVEAVLAAATDRLDAR